MIGQCLLDCLLVHASTTIFFPQKESFLQQGEISCNYIFHWCIVVCFQLFVNDLVCLQNLLFFQCHIIFSIFSSHLWQRNLISNYFRIYICSTSLIYNRTRPTGLHAIDCIDLQEKILQDEDVIKTTFLYHAVSYSSYRGPKVSAASSAFSFLYRARRNMGRWGRQTYQWRW